MKTNHTGGNWVDRTVGDPEVGGGGQIMSGQKLIATCHCGTKDTPTYEEYKANHRLISSAPELLDALIFVRKWMDMKIGKGETFPAQLSGAVSKALAKAM